MTMTMSETISKEASYGWFADAIGGTAAAVLAIVGLAGVHSEMMVSIATIIFGVALLIEGGTVLTEYAHIIFPAGRTAAIGNEFSGGGISAVFTAGVAGIVLGILALVGIHPAALTGIAAIAFGSALVFSSNAVWHLRMLKQSAAPAREWRSGSEVLAAEMAYGSTGMQVLAGIAAIVLGILALIVTGSGVLTLTALIVLGTTIVLTGSAASEAFLRVMQPYIERTTRSSSLPGPAE
jgi:hypothetical protein